MNTNDESYVCDLRFAFEQPLASRSAKLEFAFAGGNLWHPTVQAGVRTPGGNCWHGIGSTSMLVHRQASVGKKVRLYSYHGMEGVKWVVVKIYKVGKITFYNLHQCTSTFLSSRNPWYTFTFVMEPPLAKIKKHELFGHPEKRTRISNMCRPIFWLWQLNHCTFGPLRRRCLFYIWITLLLAVHNFAVIISFHISTAGFTYRLYRLKPRASRSKGASNKLVRIVSGRYMII